jgi:alpha-L-fucosidase 2
MNYWPVEAANLSDCHLPLMRFIQNVAEQGRKTAKAYFNAPGLDGKPHAEPLVRHLAEFLPACIGPTCGAWLTPAHLLHYAFTQDQTFLREYYPGCAAHAEFIQAVLVEDPKTHELVIVPSTPGKTATCTPTRTASGRHRAVRRQHLRPADFARSAQNNRAAARILGLDEEFARHLDATRARLAPTRVKRRRTYPGMAGILRRRRSITGTARIFVGLVPGMKSTPHARTLTGALACRWRGAATPPPAGAWPGKRISWPACTTATAPRNSSPAHSARRAEPVLVSTRFQIDGNYGGCAAVTEMLLQSQETTDDGRFVLELLPHCPKLAYGTVRACAPGGGFEVDMTWKDGRLVTA